MDPLDFWARNELLLLSKGGHHKSSDKQILPLKANTQLQLDVAFDYAAAGFWNEAAGILSWVAGNQEAVHPMVLYALGDFAQRAGNTAAVQYRAAAAKASA